MRPFICTVTWQIFIKRLLCASHNLVLASLSSPSFYSPSPPLHRPHFITFYFLMLNCNFPPLCLCPGCSLLANSPPSHPYIQVLLSHKNNSSATFSMNLPRFPRISVNHFSDHLPLLYHEEVTVPFSKFLDHHALSSSLLSLYTLVVLFLYYHPSKVSPCHYPPSTWSPEQSSHSENSWVNGHINAFSSVPMALCTYNKVTDHTLFSIINTVHITTINPLRGKTSVLLILLSPQASKKKPLA